MPVLDELRRAAEVRRAARDRVASARCNGHDHTPEFDTLRRQLTVATDRWASLLPMAVSEGHTMADIARAAGIAAPSLYYRLRSVITASPATPGRASSETVADQQNQVRP